MDERQNNAFTDGGATKQAWNDVKNKALEQQRLLDSWKEFSNQTTLHGIKYALSDDNGKARRVLWLVVLVSSLAFLLYQISVTIIQYTEYLSMVTISEQVETELNLPAVTVCNNNLYKASLVRELYPHVEGSFRSWADMVFGEEQMDIPRFFQEMNDTSLNDTFHDMTQTVHGLSDVYIRCKIGSVLLNCSDYTTLISTDKGPCYTFNGLRMDGENAEQLNVNKQGHMTAIQLTLDVQPFDYFIPLNYGTGLLLSIHDQHEVAPFLEDRNIVLPPGRDVYISLLKTVLTKLGRPYSKEDCVDRKYHTRGECINNCKTASVFECGQCNAGSRSVDDDPNLCTLPQIFQCSMINIPKWYNGDFECDCPVNCEQVQFEHKLSYGAFPNTLALADARRLNWTYQEPAEIAENYVNVNIYYEDLKTIYRRQTALITQWQLFSSVGGLMGLALGTSFITLLEFLDFALVAGCQKLRAITKRRNQVKQTVGQSSESNSNAIK